MIGGQIKAIVGRELVYDKESRHYRKAEYRDIVILLRSLSGWSEEFLAVLSDMGIPAYTGTRSGYFSALEVRTVLSVYRSADVSNRHVCDRRTGEDPYGESGSFLL